MEEVIATLSQIRFQGDNGFIIGIFENDSTKGFGGLGNMMSPLEGMTYRLSGEWSTHPNFGKQFKFSSYFAEKPQDTNGIYQYLVKNINGIGHKIAEELIFEYDSDTIDILLEKPKKVAAEINGLSLDKALSIQEQLLDQEKDQELMIELMGLLDLPGVRKDLPSNLIKVYKSDAVEALKKNPYIVTQFPGIGFLMADKIALHKFKIERDSIFRVKAALVYTIKQNEGNTGSTWMKKESLASEFYGNTGLHKDKMEDGLFELEVDGFMVDDEEGMVALYKTMENEKFIAEQILSMVKQQTTGV